jgi:hypothetical protein
MWPLTRAEDTSDRTSPQSFVASVQTAEASGAASPGPAGGTNIDRPPPQAAAIAHALNAIARRVTRADRIGADIDGLRRFWHILP